METILLEFIKRKFQNPIQILFHAAILGLTLTSCKPKPPEPSNLISNLLAGYTENQSPDVFGVGGDSLFAPQLLGLIRKDQEFAKGEVGALDGDPICDCQDYDIHTIKTESQYFGNDSAFVTARFSNFGQATVIQYEMIRFESRWRISNIHTANLPDLLKYFTEYDYAGDRYYKVSDHFEKPSFHATLDSGAVLSQDSTLSRDPLELNSLTKVRVLSKTKERIDSTSDCERFFIYQVRMESQKEAWVSGRYLRKTDTILSKPLPYFNFQGQPYALYELYDDGYPIGDDSGITGCEMRAIPYLMNRKTEVIQFIAFDSTKFGNRNIFTGVKGSLAFLHNEIDWAGVREIRQVDSNHIEATWAINRVDYLDTAESRLELRGNTWHILEWKEHGDIQWEGE